jgi:transposase
MGLHRNARLGVAGRRRLVADVEAGLSCREAARRRGVSPTTACKWWRRWSEATLEQKLTRVCLEDRSSRPHHMPRLLSAAEQERICTVRRRSSWGPRLIAGETGHPHATVWRTLKRAGISRPSREPRERPRLYEWPLSWRSAAHRHQALRALQPARPCGHRRQSPHGCREADADRLRVGAQETVRLGRESVHVGAKRRSAERGMTSGHSPTSST